MRVHGLWPALRLATVRPPLVEQAWSVALAVTTATTMGFMARDCVPSTFPFQENTVRIYQFMATDHTEKSLEELKARNGTISYTDLINRAVDMYNTLDEEMAIGKTIIIEGKPDAGYISIKFEAAEDRS